jgi:uridylate kinase
MNQTKYKRIILKISGEILGSREEGEPIHAKSLENICAEIKAVADMGVEIGLVVGGGNIFRGLQGSDKGIDRTTGDSMGMLATVINGLALMDRLEKIGAVVRTPIRNFKFNRCHHLKIRDPQVSVTDFAKKA